ncbi:putative ribonuclease H-like domain-containing protein [Tanacetum coccineum]
MCSTVAFPPSPGIGVVSTYTTLMLESKKCIFFYLLLKATPSNLSSLEKFKAMCFIALAAINYHRIIFFDRCLLLREYKAKAIRLMNTIHTLKQSTAEPAHIPKGYTQAISSKAPTAPNCASHSDEIICSFFAQQASMPTTHDDEDLSNDEMHEEIDIHAKFDAEPVTYAMMALTGVEQDDWSIEFDAEHMHFGQDGLDDFDWSNKADDAPVSLALMATNSEVPYCSKCSKSYKLLLENYQKERDNFQRARTEILGYQMSLESLEVMLKTHEKNEYAWGDKYEQMGIYLKIRDLKLEEKQKELDQALKEREDFKVKLEKWSNASVLQNEVLNKQRYVSDKSCIGFGIESSNSMESNISSGDETLTDSAYENFKREKAYKAVPPPTGTLHQRRSVLVISVLTRDGLISTARPTITQTVPSKSTANVTYQGTARSRVPQAVLSRSTDGSYYPRMDNRRPRISSFSPLSRSSTTRTPHRPKRPKKIVKSIWVKKGSTDGSQAVLPQTVKKSAIINSKQTWRPKGNYLDSVNRDNGSYTLKQFEYGNPEEDLKDYAIMIVGCFLKAPRKNEYTAGSKEYYSLCGITFWLQRQQRMKLVYGTEDWAVNFKISNKKGENTQSILARRMKERTVREPLNAPIWICYGPVSVESENRKNSLLPIQFWAEAVNTACYVLNRVLVTKPQMKTPYEILMGRSPNISFMRPFGCSLTIAINLRSHLGKFDGKSEKDILSGYTTNSKENQKGKGPDWMFDLDLLTPSMNYIPVRKENYADSKEQGISCDDVEDLDDQQFIVHTAQPMHPEECTAAKEVPLPLKNQALTDELRKRGNIYCKGKKNKLTVLSPQSTANTPPLSGVADYNNMDPTIDVPSTPTLRIHKIHPQSQIIGKSTAGRNKKVSQALADESWVKRSRRTNFNSKLQELPQGYRQEEGVDYDEVFAPVARIEAIRLFLAFASFMGFIVYQMDVKSAFLYGNITEEVYVKQPPGFEDPAHPNKVYRVVKALYGLHQAPRAWYYVEDNIFGSTSPSMVKDFEELMQKEFKMSSMGELTFFLGLQVKQTTAGIFLSQDKYVKDILNKFDFRTIKPASTPIEAHKSLGKDEEGEDVDVHLYRSMIGCLMYLTASRPDIMFAVCLCARFQVTPKVSHMHAVKRIFRYLKHQPKLGLWYPKDSPFHLEAFSDSDYAGDNHDRRSTSGGCQYLGRRLVSWQCKKQTIVAISSTEAEYVAAASCCAQVLWMQNQLLDYGFNFMNTEIHIDNESTICIVKNPVLHSKTKHIQIRHHFIRDCYEQRLINVVKVHTDDNVADLLTKGFDLARFNFLVVTIGMMNL